MPFTKTWMDLEGIVLSVIRERQIPCDFTYMWHLKTKEMNKQKAETDSSTQRTD